MSLGGPIKINRTVLRPADLHSSKLLGKICKNKLIIPLDDYLGISNIPFKITPGAMLTIADWVQRSNSYEDAENGLKKYTDIIINDDTIRYVANTIGSIVFNIDHQNSIESYNKLLSGNFEFPIKKKSDILYLEVDGAMVHSREKDENGTKWRENKLGLAFSSDNIRYWKSKSGKIKHNIYKREYRTFLGDVDTFKKHFIALALRNGYGKYKETVLISDGATWIRNMKNDFFPDAQQILDYFHLCENVNKYAKIIFKDNESLFKPWAKRICEQLKESKFRDVLSELKSMDKRKFKCNSFDLYKYILHNIKNIDYAFYESKGYFIGSGAIESGNKIVMQRRLKQPGMRWNIKTAQYILTLMSKSKSYLWESDVVQPILKFYGVNSYY
jgi:hypothetical protein